MFGPGGVVAVLTALWGAWWVLTRRAGRQPKSQWPAVVAFGVACGAFVSWSWLAEPVTLMSDALARRGAHRTDLATQVPAAFWAGGRALVAAWGILAAAVVGSRYPDGDAPVDLGPDRPEQALAGSSLLALLAALGIVLVSSPLLVDADPQNWLQERDLLQGAEWMGLLAVWLALALVGFTALRRVLRSRLAR